MLTNLINGKLDIILLSMICGDVGNLHTNRNLTAHLYKTLALGVSAILLIVSYLI